VRLQPLGQFHMRGAGFASNLFALGGRPAIIGPAEPAGLRVILGAKPAVRVAQPRVTAAGLQMIDAEIAGDAGADREFALDAATGRHHEIIGEDHLADLAVAVGAA
jgi:hypothetical protein